MEPWIEKCAADIVVEHVLVPPRVLVPNAEKALCEAVAAIIIRHHAACALYAKLAAERVLELEADAAAMLESAQFALDYFCLPCDEFDEKYKIAAEHKDMTDRFVADALRAIVADNPGQLLRDELARLREASQQELGGDVPNGDKELAASAHTAPTTAPRQS